MGVTQIRYFTLHLMNVFLLSDHDPFAVCYSPNLRKHLRKNVKVLGKHDKNPVKHNTTLHYTSISKFSICLLCIECIEGQRADS